MTEQSDLSGLTDKARAQKVVLRLEEFIQALNQRAGEKHASEVIFGDRKLDGRKINQKPEQFIAEELIDPISDALGYNVRFEPKGFDGLNGRIPDFTMLNLDFENFGEIKTPGDIREARKEEVEYLDMAEERPLVGFATDGRVWILYTAEEGEEPRYSRHAPLHKLLRTVRKTETTSIEEARHPHLRDLGMSFVRDFKIESVRESVQY